MENAVHLPITVSLPRPGRDPFVLLYGGRYYLYTTGWYVYRNEALASDGWEDLGKAVVLPDDYEGDPWAPEVHFYRDAFYMFTSYRSAVTHHRGSAVFRSETPEGPFVLWSDGFLTPRGRDSIDATLYLDGRGDPWTFFVDEWTSAEDGIGRMDCARLADDLKRTVTPPAELFRADDAPWVRCQVTDGPFLYTAKNGTLLMLWSSVEDIGYAVGIAQSVSGSVYGPWTHRRTPLCRRPLPGGHDGGHGMIFRDENGAMWLSVHAPNTPTEGRFELPVFLPIEEKDGGLCVRA